MTIQPLNDRIPVVNDDGTPTQYFIRMLQERGITVGEKITEEEAIALINEALANHSVNAGTGLSGGGPLISDPTLSLNASLGQLNDVDLSTPPTNGQVIAYDVGSGTWLPVNQSGGGGGGTSTYWGWGFVGLLSPSDIVATTTATLGRGAIQNAVSIAALGNHWWWTTGQTSRTVSFDFGSPTVISGIIAYQDDTSSNGTWQVEWSNDNSTWTAITSPSTWGGARSFSWQFSNSTPRRYWRLVQTSGATSNSAWQQGFMFRWGPA